jgi:hypothetical protein
MPTGVAPRAWPRGRGALAATFMCAGAGALMVTLGAQAPPAAGAAESRRPRLSSDVQFRLAPTLPPRIDAVFQELEPRVDEQRAMALVSALDGTWRLAGNADFERAQDRVLRQLVAAGFRQVTERPARLSGPSVWFESFSNAGHGWAHDTGRLAVLDADGTKHVLLSREDHGVTVCINSFSTPPGGVSAEIVDVGRAATVEALAGRDLRGRVLLGDADPGGLFRLATSVGAIGVVSTTLAPYVNPTLASSEGTPLARDEWDILQWGAIPHDARAQGFGFKATPRAAAELRARLKAGPVRVHVEIVASFTERPNRTLVAEVPGDARALEHILLVAHAQEPGANDNASGVATLQELASALGSTVGTAALGPPERTLTFLWGDEMAASREWLRAAGASGRTVRYMFALDMTGHDVSKTGGSFLIERAPDPSARQPSPFDPHTPWGGGDVSESWVRGTVLNDFMLAVCARYGARDGWSITTNPYEGGSDHAVFLEAGVPSVLVWHFPDRFYHTSLDRADKTSPREMRRVAVSVGAAAYLLASASSNDALALVGLLDEAVRDRLELERSRGADDAPWRRWYHEAFDEVGRLPARGATARLHAAVAAAQDALTPAHP